MSQDKIKYVVTEGGEVFDAEVRKPQSGERFMVEGLSIETAMFDFNSTWTVLTEPDTPQFVPREVVEPLFVAAKQAVQHVGSSRSNHLINNSGSIVKMRKALAATEEALHPKPKERFEVNGSNVIDTDVPEGEPERTYRAATQADALNFKNLLNAQEGDAS